MIEKLASIITEYTGKENIEINENSQLLTDIGLSSLDLVNLVCRVEEEFDVEIPDREIKNIKTIGDVIDFINKQ